MEMFLIGLAVGLVIGGVFFGGLLFARAGSLNRAWWGLAVAQRTAADPSLQARIDSLLANPLAPVPTNPPVVVSEPVKVEKRGPIIPPAPKPSGEPLQLLAILQKEARLLDTLFEKLDTVDAIVVKNAILRVQKDCQAVLGKYLTIEGILPETDEKVTVDTGFDPSAISVIGNVTGQPPFTGTLIHPGYRVKEIKLPTRPEGQDPMILMPAEVEM